MAALIAVVSWLKALSPAGVSRLLDRLGISRHRGQAHLHSPDPDYDAKLAQVAAARQEAAVRPGRVELLYQDECSYYRRPSVAPTYAAKGRPGQRAEQGLRSNTARRIIGAVNARTGAGFYWQRAHADVATLRRYYAALADTYPDAEVVYVAQDNWPVHFHPDLVAALAATKIRLLRLPTYAPWTNPIEKVWRWLRQEVVHQHEFATDWERFQEVVTAWLERHTAADPAILRYVGLHPD